MSAPFFSDSQLPATVQPSLFPELELDLLSIDKPETRKRYTAESLTKRMELRDAIVRALAEGWGLLRIAKVYGVSHHLVSALRDARPDLVAIEKKQLSGQIGRILKLSADKYEEALVEGKVPPGQIPVAFGIFADKKAVLDGDAGMIVEHRHTLMGTAEGFRERLRQAASVATAAEDSTSSGNGSISEQKGVLDVVAERIDTAPAGTTEIHAAAGRVVAGAVGGGPEEILAGGPGGGDGPVGLAAGDPMHQLNGGEQQKEVL